MNDFISEQEKEINFPLKLSGSKRRFIAFTILLSKFILVVIAIIILMMIIPKTRGIIVGSSIVNPIISNATSSCASVTISGIKNADITILESIIMDLCSDHTAYPTIKEIESSIKSYQWIKSVKISRKLLKSIAIKIVEYEPYLLWFNGDSINIVSDNGVMISINNLEQIQLTYPKVEYDGDIDHIMELIDIIKSFPITHATVDRIIFINDRRWNVIVNDIIIKMPEDNLTKAWERLAIIISKEWLSKDIEWVDLRIHNKIFIKYYE